MIEVNNLVKKYKNHVAVNGISININKGEVFGLLGPNGAGKSTTVSMLSTVLAPTSGDIRINNLDLKRDSKKIKTIMGIVPQDLALYDTLSCKDNLMFFGSLYGLKGKKLKKRVAEVLETVELTHKADEPISSLSGGMKRRINIGVTLMHKPQVIIFDEPTVGIDPQSRNHILKTIKTLNEEQGVTVIYTSHYMEEVEYLCDRVAIVDSGKVIVVGKKEELKEMANACDILNIKLKEIDQEKINKLSAVKDIVKFELQEDILKVYLTPGKDAVADVLDKIKGLGIQMKTFSYEEANLESIFLQLTGKTLRD